VPDDGLASTASFNPLGTPRLLGKSDPPVPLPTIPLPHVDSPFPCLPEPRLADALASSILTAPNPTTHLTEFRFEWSQEAVAHNLAVLRCYSLDLGGIRAQPFSALTPGSEFRAPELLAPFLSAHPLRGRFQERITEGAEFPLRKISETDRLADVRANLTSGNHKLARGHEAKLIEMLKEEVGRGWQLPLSRDSALKIKGCKMTPLDMVAQTSIDENGNPIDKRRLTHDQSFSPSGQRDVVAKRKQQGEHISADGSKVRESIQPTALSHLVLLARSGNPEYTGVPSSAFVGMVAEFREGAARTYEDVLLSQGGSMSASGWLAKSSFDNDCPLHLTIARAFADFCLTHEIVHYTQWFPGKENKMADMMLSRDFALDNAQLTLIIQ
jgi:hypothetical protein